MGQGRYRQYNIDVQGEGQDVESLGVGTHSGEQAYQSPGPAPSSPQAKAEQRVACSA